VSANVVIIPPWINPWCCNESSVFGRNNYTSPWRIRVNWQFKWIRIRCFLKVY
jgi:hypothetical protein